MRHLGIVDLPGLGEFAARADEHHVGGLQNEVDVVLLVKRPVEGMAYWGDADARALDLIDSARGFVDRRDFVVLVLNTGDTADALVTALRDHIRGQVNSGVPDQFFQVLECDAADAGDVFARVLSPVLAHLAARMPAMDADAVAGTRGELRAVAQRIATLTDDVARVLASVAQSSGAWRRISTCGRGGCARTCRGRSSGWSASCARRPGRSGRTRTTPTPWSARTPPRARGSRTGSGSASRRGGTRRCAP